MQARQQASIGQRSVRADQDQAVRTKRWQPGLHDREVVGEGDGLRGGGAVGKPGQVLHQHVQATGDQARPNAVEVARRDRGVESIGPGRSGHLDNGIDGVTTPQEVGGMLGGQEHAWIQPVAPQVRVQRGHGSHGGRGGGRHGDRADRVRHQAAEDPARVVAEDQHGVSLCGEQTNEVPAQGLGFGGATPGLNLQTVQLEHHRGH